MIDWNDAAARAAALKVLTETVLLDVHPAHLVAAIAQGGQRCTLSRAEALIAGVEQPLLGEMWGIVNLAKAMAVESDRHNRTAAPIFADAALLIGPGPTSRN